MRVGLSAPKYGTHSCPQVPFRFRLVPVRESFHLPASQALVCIRSFSNAGNEYYSALFEYAVDDPIAAPTEGNPIVVSEITKRLAVRREWVLGESRTISEASCLRAFDSPFNSWRADATSFVTHILNSSPSRSQLLRGHSLRSSASTFSQGIHSSLSSHRFEMITSASSSVSWVAAPRRGALRRSAGRGLAL